MFLCKTGTGIHYSYHNTDYLKLPTLFFLAVYYFYSEQQSKATVTVSVLKDYYKLHPINRIEKSNFNYHFSGLFLI